MLAKPILKMAASWIAIATFAALGLAAGAAYLVLTRPVRARLALEERSEPTIVPAG